MKWQPGVRVSGNLVLYDMHANREVIMVAWDKEADWKKRKQIAHELQKAQTNECDLNDSVLEELAAKETTGEFVYE